MESIGACDSHMRVKNRTRAGMKVLDERSLAIIALYTLTPQDQINEISSLQDQCESFTLTLSSSREEHGERYNNLDFFILEKLGYLFLSIAKIFNFNRKSRLQLVSKRYKQDPTNDLTGLGICGLHCIVIAKHCDSQRSQLVSLRAFILKVKLGGGGLNAAIFEVAGPDLDSATKKQARFFTQGKAITIPLPSTSPLLT
ncbi:hypothetical protein LXL04_024153 [Taraxacum kok-saghyz]